MCGLAGVVCRNGRVDWPHVLGSMGETLVHRGPDDSGHWYDVEGGVGLTHRRLSIMDLSAAGHQPMVSNSSRYVIAFNGEIYNYWMLRADLEAKGIAFRGHSDTEVLLAAFEEWGISKTLVRANGMFGIALWDRSERELILARDRLGEKPLYYGWADKAFLFASELKAICAYPAFRRKLDERSLALYLRFNYVPSPFSIYSGVQKLEPGTWLKIHADRAGEIAGHYTYWSVEETVSAGVSERFKGSRADAVDTLEELLASAVRLRMKADVPMGAFLSGGVDSSTIVSLMQAYSSDAIRTYSIGFQEGSHDEASYARRVAAHLGTKHTEFYVTPSDALAEVPRMPAMYDEPFGDSSQIPTFLVAKLARNEVTVSLSGDGGDELFGGYNRYVKGCAFWRRFGWVPSPIRELGGRWLAFVLSPGLCSRILNTEKHFAGGNPKGGTLCDKADKLGHLLGASNLTALYAELVYLWRDPNDVMSRRVLLPDIVRTVTENFSGLLGDAERMMAIDMKTYLPGDILTKIDRATMAVGLEGRIPFLDPEVMEFSGRIPERWKIAGSEGKWILREVLYRYVPRSLMERPKMGFSMPIAGWLRGDLREWGEELLDRRKLEEQGVFNPGPLRQAWEDHVSGRRNLQYKLWNVLMFQAWHQRWLGQTVGTPSCEMVH